MPEIALESIVISDPVGKTVEVEYEGPSSETDADENDDSPHSAEDDETDRNGRGGGMPGAHPPAALGVRPDGLGPCGRGDLGVGERGRSDWGWRVAVPAVLAGGGGLHVTGGE